MTDATPSPLWIDVSGVDDPRDVVHRAVACLAQGGVVGAATETLYGLAMCALQSGAIARISAGGSGNSRRPPIVLLKGPDEISDWVPSISAVGRRMTRRLWPGPTVFTFPLSLGGVAGRLPAEAREIAAPAGEISFSNPASPMIRDIMRLLPSPLMLAPIGRSDQPPTISAECLRGCGEVDMVLDTGITYYQRPPTFVRMDEAEWTIEREGVVDAETLRETARVMILFVCTGNTCRSPMAEGICKLILANRLGCQANELEERGYTIRSAGMAASSGEPAAGNAIEVVRGLGGSLESHKSRGLDANLARQADHIFAMTADHLNGLLGILPDVEDRAALLDPGDRDVSDPYGGDRETYRRTASLIQVMLERRLDELGL